MRQNVSSGPFVTQRSTRTPQTIVDIYIYIHYIYILCMYMTTCSINWNKRYPLTPNMSTALVSMNASLGGSPIRM